MSANVESMFYVATNAQGIDDGRQVPWHGLGTPVMEAPNSEEALKLAGLDWTVSPHAVKDAETGLIIPNTFSNTRSSDNKSLGIVTDRYKIVQNVDAFRFTDELLGSDVRYETAGSLKEGRTIWLLARLPETEILGDKFEQYLVFANSHDGTGRVRVCCTPTRVVCNNTLNFALDTAKRSWSMTHAGNIEYKLDEAHKTLELAGKYISRLKVEADKRAIAKVSDEQFNTFVCNLFPITEDMSDRQKGNAEQNRASLIKCYDAEDLVNFVGTQWGVLNAVSDFATHTTPNRMTDTYWENNWGKVMEGHPIMDKAYDLLKAM